MVIENNNSSDPTQQIQSQNHHHHKNNNNNQKPTTAVSWGTWEELLLACAVKRHGTKNWDTVSLEVQSKSSLPHSLTTPDLCHSKYLDLHRRFSDHQQPPLTDQNDTEKVEDEDDDDKKRHVVDGDCTVNNGVPWIEELRKLRVDELRREVQRHDSSILSLQLKVKRLEEEREASLQDEERKSEQSRPDLKQGDDGDRSGSENHNNISLIKNKERLETDRLSSENRSVNESNSTGGGKVKVDPGLSGSDSKLAAPPVEEVRGEEESNEVGGDDSVTQLSGEVQSSASLGGKRKRKERSRRRTDGVGGGGGGSSGGAVKREVVRPEPLVKVLDMIRAHQHCSLFEGRLESQETEEYKNIVRQHLDLETIQTRMEEGSYTTSTSSQSLNLPFYRDLLLLFNNAIVFFPKSSPESLAAMGLRSLVLKEMKKETQKSDSTATQQGIVSQPKTEQERSDSWLTKHKSSVPLVVCRKRSSMTKPSASVKTEQQQESNESKPTSDHKPAIVEDSLLKMNVQDRPVTGARSSRRNTKKLAENSNNPIKKQNTSSSAKGNTADKPETPKPETRRSEALALEKKRSAADFLKRIKKNSPVDPVKKSNTRGGGGAGGSGSGGGGGEEKKETGKKVEKGKDKASKKTNEKKQTEEDHSPSSRRNAARSSTKKGVETSRGSTKRGRESNVKEAPKRPKKRSRR